MNEYDKGEQFWMVYAGEDRRDGLKFGVFETQEAARDAARAHTKQHRRVAYVVLALLQVEPLDGVREVEL